MSATTFVEQDGRKYQGWFLRDEQIHKIGETVAWKPDFNSPGEWINGLHNVDSFSADDEEKVYYLVIKDFKLIAVHAVPDGVEPALVKAELRERYDLPVVPRDLWPEMAWEAAAWRKELREQQQAARKVRYREAAIKKWNERKAEDRDPHDLGLIHAAQNPVFHFFEELNREPTTLEEAIKLAEAVDAVNEFTRAKMRESGSMRMLFGPYVPRPELTPDSQAAILDWGMWGIPEPMLNAAITYKIERRLRELGKWDTTKFWRIRIDWRPFEPQVLIEELQGETRPAE